MPMTEYFKSLGVKIGFYLVLALLIIGGLLAWRAWEGRSVIVDNPTDEEISFQIDGKTYHLSAETSEKITLKNGEHTLKIDGEEYPFKKEGFALKGGVNAVLDQGLGAAKYAILNPTQSVYVLSHEYYGDGDPEYPEDQDFDAVYFEVRADYGLDESYPDTISLSKGTKGAFKTKLFRGREYLEEYDLLDEMGEDDDYVDEGENHSLSGQNFEGEELLED